LLDFSASSTTWQTASPGFSAPIDRLRIIVATVGNGSNVLDNLVLTQTTSATPEPASLTLLGFGAVGLLGYGWRQRRRVLP
jgi:MYXO-CTERM domain-containing protein